MFDISHHFTLSNKHELLKNFELSTCFKENLGLDFAMAELVVYGRSSCSACSRFKGSCEHGGLKYRFADIDVTENKAEMLRKLRAAEWFKGGKCLLCKSEFQV